MTDLTLRSRTAFYLRAIGAFAQREAARRRSGEGYKRTAQQVLTEYEPSRFETLEDFRASPPDFADFLTRLKGDEYNRGTVCMVDGELTRDPAPARWLLLGALERAVAPYEPKTFVEVGAGTGRNLLYLLSRFPGSTGLGLELTPSGVAVGNAAAEHYGLPATFHEMDVSQPDWGVDNADVVYSVAALEQMPEIAGRVMDLMEEHASKAVVMLEPFPDFWDGLAGIAMKMRARHLDRLKAGNLARRQVVRIERLTSGNPLNMSTEVHLLPRTSQQLGVDGGQ